MALKKLGLKVNDGKTEIYLLHPHHQGNVTLQVNGVKYLAKQG